MLRRLTTIVAADVAGYSRLIGVDEEGTLAAMRALRAEIIDPNLSTFGGRVANTAGDSLLIEFPSAVEAVRCAIAMQEATASRASDLPEDQRILFRIGVNVGDVVAEGEDLLGDGVNVAARLEGLAPPGGIVLSGSAFDQVRDRLDAQVDKIGEVEVKNIARPVRAYQVRREGEARVKAPRRGSRLLYAAVAALLLIFGGVFWMLQDVGDDQAMRSTALALPDQPSIAVLPFQDLSEDNPQEWFGDGMAEDIITDLSKLSGLFVIARNSSFAYRGGNHDVKGIGTALGVAFILEGSVRRAGDKMRINAQLIDAATGGHVWADRFDGTAEDVFALQDRVAKSVVASLALELTEAEVEAISALKTSVAAAHDAYLQALSHMHRFTREDFAAAKQLLDKSLDLDPTYSEALGARATLYLDAQQRGWIEAVNIRGDRTDTVAAIRAALKYPSAAAFSADAELLLEAPNVRAAKESVEKGLELVPGDPDLLLLAGYIEALIGNSELAVALTERAMRLNPDAPVTYLRGLGATLATVGDLKGALIALDQANEQSPDDWVVNLFRAVVLAELGQINAAAADLTFVQENWPNQWTSNQTAWFYAWILGRAAGPEVVARYEAAFIAAGVPELPTEFDLTKKDRLDRKAYLALRGQGFRAIGRCCNGLEWMNDNLENGDQIRHINGRFVRKTTATMQEDGSLHAVGTGRYDVIQRCAIYGNSRGTNETLDAYVSVCSNGVYPFGVFPLPE